MIDEEFNVIDMPEDQDDLKDNGGDQMAVGDGINEDLDPVLLDDDQYQNNTDEEQELIDTDRQKS